MALEFNDSFEIPPIPIDARKAAAQRAIIVERASILGDLDQVKTEAVNAILNAAVGDEPSEQKRFRLLYQKIYTHDELNRFVDITFARLGLGNVQN